MDLDLDNRVTSLDNENYSNSSGAMNEISKKRKADNISAQKEKQELKGELLPPHSRSMFLK